VHYHIYTDLGFWVELPVLEVGDLDGSLVAYFARDGVAVHVHGRLFFVELDGERFVACVVDGDGTQIVRLSDGVFLIDLIEVGIDVGAVLR